MIDQMELGFAARAARSRRQRDAQRRQRAQWWFARMRGVVDAALDWAPTPAARPEQAFMTLEQERG